LFIPDPDLDFSPIPDLGSGGQKGTGSRIRIRNPGDEVPKNRRVREALASVEPGGDVGGQASV
jgi:hypothetical protein